MAESEHVITAPSTCLIPGAQEKMPGDPRSAILQPPARKRFLEGLPQQTVAVTPVVCYKLHKAERID